MDAVTGALIGRVIEGYFSIFFKNFKKEDFKLNIGLSNETTSTLHNLELNTDVVQEIIGIPNFAVRSVTINTLEVKMRFTSIKKLPIVVSIDRIDCILEEPYTQLKPLPTVLEDFFKKLLPNSGKSSYGFVEKIIDGVTIEIKRIRTEIITRGRYKTPENGNWTPPVLICNIEGVSAVATNERWEVVDLKSVRQYNEKKPEIFIFKVITVSKLSCEVVDNGITVPLINNMPMNIYVTIKKGLDNVIKGISGEIKINNFNLLIKMNSILYFVRLLDGITCCMDRRDIQLPPSKIPHQALVLCLILREMSITIEEEGRGVELTGENIQVGVNWPEQSPSYEKFIEFCVPMIRLREFANGGNESNSLLQPDYSKQFKNPFATIPPLLKTLHPNLNPYILDRPPLFYMKAVTRNPSQRPLFDKEVLALSNPMLMIVRQESITRLLELTAACSPYLQQIQDFQSLKPSVDLSNVIVQETRNPFEDLLSLKFDIGGVTMMFPSSTGKFANISFHVLESTLLSHPKLPESDSFNSGLPTLTTFPGEADDFIHKREETRTSSLHFVKFKVLTKFAITMQSDSAEESLLEMPNIALDFGLFVGESPDKENEQNSEVIKERAMRIKLIQGSLILDTIKGNLTQIQYKTLLNRAYMLLPIFPLLQKIQGSFKSVERPETPLIFLLKVNSAEWALLDDSIEGKILPLAAMSIANLQCLIENAPLRKVAKILLGNFNINALPAIDYKTSLYDPNAFVSTNPNEPLIVVRVKKAVHPPGELLKKEEEHAQEEDKGYLQKAAGFLKNMSYNRAFHVGDRSKIDVRISGFRSGINPNPACKILTFFLRSELNIKRILATLDQARSSLDLTDALNSIKSVDIVELTDNIVIDIDFNLHIKDCQFYFVRDKEVGTENGNIGFLVQDLIVDRHTEGKYVKKTNFLISNITLICNKEENDVVTPIYVFKPVSFKYNSKREWDLNTLQWIIESSGGMDKFDIAVNPSHSGVFLNVLNGIKMQNIQDVVDCITSYMNQEVGSEPLASIAPASKLVDVNPFSTHITQLQDTLNGLDDKLTFAAKEKATIADNLKQLQMKSNVLAFASKSEFVNNLEGRAFVKRFAVLSDNSLFLFESEKCITQLCQLAVSNQTALELVQNIPNSIQVTSGAARLILQAQDEVAMSQWVNEILKMQVGGEGNIKINDGIAQCKESVQEARNIITAIGALSEELGEKATLLAKIKALEAELQQKNQLISQLQK